jgi:hypothetical protein
LPSFHLERDVIHRSGVRILFGQLVYFNHRNFD